MRHGHHPFRSLWPRHGRTGLLAVLALAGSGLAAAADPRPIRQVSAGIFHTCAVTEAGEAWCWGGNCFGQLGRGDNSGPRHGPGRVSISTPGFGTCAPTTAGQVFCWGINSTWGTLGAGPGTPGRSVPTPVNTDSPRFGADNTAALSRNGYGYQTNCALTDSGQAFC